MTDSEETIYYTDEECNNINSQHLFEKTVWYAFNNFYGDLKFL